jgi:hypothetical protein
MCGLCGTFGVAEHWTDGASGATSRADRQHRVAVANRFLAVYGLKLADWSGRFTLTSQTGGTAIIDHFGVVWPAAERLTGQPCDPLDPELIRALDRESGRR